MKLSDIAYNALNKIADRTKMDCWFYIMASGNDDVVYDIENGEILLLEVGLTQFAEGIVDSLDVYGLTEDEKRGVVEVFESLNIPLGG